MDMNVYTEALDPLDVPIKPRRGNAFCTRYYGHKVGHLTFKGSIRTSAEAEEMIKFFKVMAQALKI